MNGPTERSEGAPSIWLDYDPRVKLPHHEDFPHRRDILIWVSVLCVAVAAVWPGQSLGDRLYDIGIALLSFAICYGFTRLILGGLVAVAQEHFEGVPLWCVLLVFYGGLLSTVCGLIAAPLHWHEVHPSGASGPAILAALPSGLFTAAATLKIIEKYYPPI
jgi:hypothetical protein